MKVDLYSERERLARPDGPAQYQYDDIPETLRVQISQIATAALGPDDDGPNLWTQGCNKLPSHTEWRSIQRLLCREYGRDTLINAPTPMMDVLGFFRNEATAAQCLDIIEVLARIIYGWAAKLHPEDRNNRHISQSPRDAINEINVRLRRAGCGYQFDSGNLVRVDSQYLHSEVVHKCLALLTEPTFEGVQSEFVAAHRHHRVGEHEQAIFQAGKAFESTLKVACDERDWTYPRNAGAKDLLDTVFANDLIPEAARGQIQALRATLEQGPPVIRNALGGHGTGSSKREVPEYVVAYMLHITASAIVLIGSSLQQQPTSVRGKSGHQCHHSTARR